jgi:lipopolysaccharide biosynthesis glycosyltransferase
MFALAFILKSLLFILVFLRSGNSSNEPVNIVSVIDGSSLKLSLIKSFSIIKSTAHPERLVFHFLVMPILKEFGAKSFEQQFKKLFPGIAVHTKIFSPPPSNVLDDKNSVHSPFEEEHVPYFQRPVMFARLFIPTVFNLDYFVYLDNDIICTIDITSIYPYDLNGLTSGYVHYNNTVMAWITNVFNLSHPVVQQAFSHRGKYFYFNSGVWFCDAKLWRAQGLPGRMQNLLMRFRQEGILTNAASDQELVFILLENNTALLPANLNMDTQLMRTHLDAGHTGQHTIQGHLHRNDFPFM